MWWSQISDGKGLFVPFPFLPSADSSWGCCGACLVTEIGKPVLHVAFHSLCCFVFSTKEDCIWWSQQLHCHNSE